MTKVLIASNNPGKIKEFKDLLQGFGADVFSLKDLGITTDVPETGHTFHENAALKAEALAKETGMITLADDSGLCVDALNGEPGVFSARYSGPEKDSERNIDLLLHKLKGVPEEKRTAHFVCVLALSRPKHQTRFAEGRCDGIITATRRGVGGFGYDPLFLIPERQETFAEMGEAEKNQISHRARALRVLKENWTSWTGEA
ncbi:XTP/dITP diphosphatase [Sporolactobacillus inulinus]|uniref:dITP/XTP pyrophosphatase n=1 Tax=Sporolactobacillus inulinus CASD TaxID=1069536 RepID=A0A0U1QNF0_9BACL|nr:XTP/dITP diphosphatase [Sporolactobacillus inulinus]KLI02327.1 nucleoside-triphosphate diphosphatase [Sporolactobacillus inulinus CASD]GEB75665.1 non-canonical purine NTP pyrophosphatase [Sporolactobacillus inulinus]